MLSPTWYLISLDQPCPKDSISVRADPKEENCGIIEIDSLPEGDKRLQRIHCKNGEFKRTDLGNLSASKTTVSMPSRPRQEAAYEPAGPPPITSTEVWVGIDIWLT